MKNAHTGNYWAKACLHGLSFCRHQALGSSGDTRKALDLALNPRPTTDYVLPGASHLLNCPWLLPFYLSNDSNTCPISTGAQWKSQLTVCHEQTAPCKVTAPLALHWATSAGPQHPRPWHAFPPQTKTSLSTNISQCGPEKEPTKAGLRICPSSDDAVQRKGF